MTRKKTLVLLIAVSLIAISIFLYTRIESNKSLHKAEEFNTTIASETSQATIPQEQLKDARVLYRPVFVLCGKNNPTAAEELVCSTPELLELNLRVKTLYGQAKVKMPKDWSEWYEKLMSCEDNKACLKKSFQDHIARLNQ